MISIEEALQIVKSNMPPPTVRVFALEEAIGRCLAEDIHAPEPSPRYDNSAMDGYAVRWADIGGATPAAPVALKVVGESRAGGPFPGTVKQGEAVRISTGARLAAGCDTIVRVEDSEEQNSLVNILAVKKAGQDVRRQGEEFQQGDRLLSKGTRISAPQAALLAAVGLAEVKAYKPCQVAVLVTGSELVGAGAAIADYQIRDSNMIMLKAAVREAGAEVTPGRRISDEKLATREAIGQAAADIILCTGGVSVGRHDHVKEAAEANGFVPLFWRVRQKPGKPLYLARKGNALLFGLPGNPVSAFMCFSHYVRPVIRALNGRPFGWPTKWGEAAADITNPGRRPNMIRVQFARQPNGGWRISPVAKQGSHMLTSLAEAGGYLILEAGQILKAGENHCVYRFS